ncbi:MAG: type III pantothenate kinase [Gammaproteobacteria bacterium]|nr:type III pantothenate kinase [Gammaproteobacteria bacterium]NNM00970.1 type III pantothenate kinase [Gammaproteobacteria bacterium]
MWLLVDLGNSRLKSAWHAPGHLDTLVPYDWRSESFDSGLEQRWAGGRPDRIVCANVAGKRCANKLSSYARERWGREVEYLDVNDAAAGVTNRYAAPEQLGIDRWALAVAAFELAGGPVVAIDAGTALNVEFVDADGDYLGGLIAPGIGLLADSLASNTENLFVVDQSVRAGIGRNTVECIGSGIQHMLSGFVWRAERTALDRFGSAPSWLVTGGDAERFSDLTNMDASLVPDLVLRGIALLAGSKC